MLSLRFGVYLPSLVAGGLLAVWSRSFTGAPLEWVAFGVSAAVLVAGVIGLTTRRNIAGYGALSLIAAWSAVAALVFTGSALTWLVFADALAVAAVSLAGLTVHELSTERVVHTLDVRSNREQLTTAA